MNAASIIKLATNRSMQLSLGYEAARIYHSYTECPIRCPRWLRKQECDDLEAWSRIPDCPHGERGESPGDQAVIDRHHLRAHGHAMIVRGIIDEIGEERVAVGYYCVEITGHVDGDFLAEIAALGGTVSEIVEWDGSIRRQIAVHDPEVKSAN